MNESELILAVQQGDQAAFEELVHCYEKKVYSLCYRMLGNDKDAEEAAQDTFLAVWRGVGEFRRESAFSTWLYRLASNACIDLLRRSKRTAMNGVSLDGDEAALSVRDNAATPQEVVEQKEMRTLIEEGLAALPEDYRRVLILRELQQMSYAEIAQAAELELGTVRSRISRARQLLRNYLTAHGNFFEKATSKRADATRTCGEDMAHDGLL